MYRLIGRIYTPRHHSALVSIDFALGLKEWVTKWTGTPFCLHPVILSPNPSFRNGCLVNVYSKIVYWEVNVILGWVCIPFPCLSSASSVRMELISYLWSQICSVTDVVFTSVMFTLIVCTSIVFKSIVFTSVVFTPIVCTSIVFKSIVFTSVVFTSVVFTPVVFTSVVSTPVIFMSIMLTSVVFTSVVFTSVMFTSVVGLGLARDRQARTGGAAVPVGEFQGGLTEEEALQRALQLSTQPNRLVPQRRSNKPSHSILRSVKLLDPISRSPNFWDWSE